MLHSRKQRVLQRMRERAVADVVEQNCKLGALIFIVGDVNSLEPQVIKNTAHQVKGSKGMLKPRVDCPRVDQIGQAQLFYVAQSLKVRMGNDVEYQFTFDVNKSIQRIVNDFLFVQ